MLNVTLFQQKSLPYCTQLAAHQDDNTCACSLWLLGQVHCRASHLLSQHEKGESYNSCEESCQGINSTVFVCVPVPPNYNYLPSTSVLSSIHAQLEALSSKSSTRSVERPCWLANCILLLGHASEQQSKEAVSCLLQVLAASERQLPPCDLSSILTPLCRSSKWPHGPLAYALF